jgi:hypothetical protein
MLRACRDPHGVDALRCSARIDRFPFGCFVAQSFVTEATADHELRSTFCEFLDPVPYHDGQPRFFIHILVAIQFHHSNNPSFRLKLVSFKGMMNDIGLPHILRGLCVLRPGRPRAIRAGAVQFPWSFPLVPWETRPLPTGAAFAPDGITPSLSGQLREMWPLRLHL